jgi:dTDP-4-dehydrorhamnose 3,5-epimerase
MEFVKTQIPDVIVIQPKLFGDDRGFFMETFRADLCVANGISGPFVQDNHSGSQQGVLRGLHYQIHQPQGKLVRVVVGEIFDVVVDIRRSSETFGKWIGATLSAKNKQQLWLPAGFAHGFYVISEWAEVVYKATDYYSPQKERSILWNDPDLNIDWPILAGFPPSLSKKDLNGLLFKDAEVFD